MPNIIYLDRVQIKGDVVDVVKMLARIKGGFK